MRSPSPLVLALALLAVASVRAQAPTTNTVNTWKEASGVFTAGGGLLAGCTAETDAFPEKARVAFANFAVEYKKTYKIVTNKGATPPLKYLLWQRGCPKPSEADSKSGDGSPVYAGVFEIPLRSVAITSATYFGALEVMGERAALRLINDFGLYTSLPCVHKQVADKYTLVKTGKWSPSVGYHTVPNATNGVKVPDEDLNALKIEATFAACSLNAATQKCELWSTSHPGLVQVADTMETNFYAMGEWIEYHALFFNRETAVQQVTDLSRERWLCHSNNNNMKEKKKVLLLDYFNTSYPDYATYKGWELKACQVCPDGPDPLIQVGSEVFSEMQCVTKDGSKKAAVPSPTYRWCEMIKAAGAVALNADLHTIPVFKDQTESKDKGPWKGYQLGSRSGLTDAQLISFAKDADIIILLTGGCTAWSDPVTFANKHTPATCKDAWTSLFSTLGGIKAVAAQQVWDLQQILQPSGGVDYLSQSVIEPDVLLEDMIKAVSGDTSQATKKHSYQFMRNTYKDGWGNMEPCTATLTVGCVPKKEDLVKQCSDHSKIHPLKADACSGGVPTKLAATAASLLLSACVALLAFVF